MTLNVCEHTFLKMKYIKSEHRARLTGKHLKAMHQYQGRYYRRLHRFYCKIFSLKAQVNLLLLNVTLHQ